MRKQPKGFPARLAELNGAPAVHIRDPFVEIEYLVQITEEPDAGGRYQITTMVARPDPGVRFPDSTPHRMLTEVAAQVLGRELPAARGGNLYRGPSAETLREMVERGMTHAEMAEELGRPTATVSSWIKRARRLDPDFPMPKLKDGSSRKPGPRQAREQAAAARRRERRAAAAERVALAMAPKAPPKR